MLCSSCLWMLQLLLMASDVLYMNADRCWCLLLLMVDSRGASIAVEMCSTLWIVQHGHWRKCILMVVRRCVHAGVVYWLSCFWLVAMLQCWGSCTVAGGMLLLMMLYKCCWLCFCWWYGSLLDYFWWTWWWISLLFMEINRFCLGSWNWSNWWRNNQLSECSTENLVSKVF
uniref:Candidate secreted effector n=1 Tax=Meloidogyne incognita TaxID=6306 RepID=A0A914KP11_MELIC